MGEAMSAIVADNRMPPLGKTAFQLDRELPYFPALDCKTHPHYIVIRKETPEFYFFHR